MDKVHPAALDFMDDPLRYGVELSRKVLEGLIGHAVTQKIVPAPIALKELFAGPVIDAVG